MSELTPQERSQAERLGVATSYDDWAGQPQEVSASTVRRLLALLGDPATGAPPVGERPRCADLPDARTWGWQVQLYGVRSTGSWGIGDLADLRTLAEWTARDLGGDFVLVNPLHAAAPGLPQEPSPYSATSRRFTNPMYLALDEVPELSGLPRLDRERFEDLRRRAQGLNSTDLVDRDAAYTLKSQAWDLLAAAPLSDTRRQAFDEYAAREGRALEDFALFCAISERHPTPWQEWPADLRSPGSSGVAALRTELSGRVDVHRRLQWWCDEQLADVQAHARAAGMRVGVVHDLAVGVDAGGADAWTMQELLALDYTVGAPPDSFSQRGQTWALPPIRPDRLSERRFAPFREMVRSLLRHAGGLRIDHALGLWRLWWVPVEEEATEGTYVRYPADALLAVLAEESQAASAIVVAEDLGTVPEGIPETLREAGIASSAVLWFEREDDGDVKPASAYPDAALASVTTHDLPTARGFWRGTATRVRHDLDLFPDEAAAQAQYAVDERERATMLDRLRRDGLVGDEPDETELVLGMHVLVARSPARLFAVSLSDATGEVRQPNMPGTIHQYPSWRLPLADGSGRPLLLEDVVADPEVRRLAAAVRTARSTKITD